MSRKNLPEPNVDDLTATLRGRFSHTSHTSRTRETGRTPERVRRSWYMPADTAAALETAVEDLHFATRRPKHEVLAELIGLGLERAEDARQRLESRRTDGEG